MSDNDSLEDFLRKQVCRVENYIQSIPHPTPHAQGPKRPDLSELELEHEPFPRTIQINRGK